MRILADTIRVRSPWGTAPKDRPTHDRKKAKSAPVQGNDSMHSSAPWTAKPGLSALRHVGQLQLQPCMP
jgi:hypothetical protein